MTSSPELAVTEKCSAVKSKRKKISRSWYEDWTAKWFFVDFYRCSKKLKYVPVSYYPLLLTTTSHYKPLVITMQCTCNAHVHRSENLPGRWPLLGSNSWTGGWRGGPRAHSEEMCSNSRTTHGRIHESNEFFIDVSVRACNITLSWWFIEILKAVSKGHKSQRKVWKQIWLLKVQEV